MSVELKLKEYKELEGQLKLVDNQILTVKNNYGTIKGVNYDGMPKGSGVSSPVEDALIRKEDDLIKLKLKRISLRHEIRSIDNMLNLLSDLERKILISFYINNSSWVQIGIDKSYSTGNLRRIRNKALEKLDNLYSYLVVI